MIDTLDGPSVRTRTTLGRIDVAGAARPSRGGQPRSGAPTEAPAPSRATARRAAAGARALVMPLMWFVIATVATYDCYTTVKYFKTLPQLEMNPVGRWLMDLDGPGWDASVDQLALFLALKVAGTIAVLFTLQTIERVWRRWSLTITSSIASAQVALGVCLLL